jgi:hypothetical protein
MLSLVTIRQVAELVDRRRAVHFEGYGTPTYPKSVLVEFWTGDTITMISPFAVALRSEFSSR